MHSWKRVFASVCVLAMSLLAGAQQTPVSYDMKVRIEPEQGSLAVQARLTIPPERVQAGELRFDLHETFVITKLTIDGAKAEYSAAPAEFSPVKPASKTVSVKVPGASAGKTVQLEIEYAGRLKALPEFGVEPGKPSLDDQVNARMVELASYSSWFPQFPWGQPIHVTLEVSLPQGWTTICSGKRVRESVQQGRVITEWVSPKDVDIVVLASREYRKREVRQSGVAIEIYDTRMPAPFLDRESAQIACVIGLFNARLGETTIPSGTVKHVYSPKRKGQGLAGFARPGLIVTSEGRTMDSLAGDPNFSLFQGIAHEIAHFWWNFGSGQGDWVNEAFSEYYSAIAVQKLVSEEEFQKVMARYRESVGGLPADAPSLSRVPFADGMVNWIVRYQKGALMLDDFRRAMGDEKFFAASRDFFQTHREQSIGTAEFRAFWKPRMGDKADVVDRWLESGGGLPRSPVVRVPPSPTPDPVFSAL